MKSRLTNWSPLTREGWSEGSFSCGKDEVQISTFSDTTPAQGLAAHYNLTKGKSPPPLSVFYSMIHEDTYAGVSQRRLLAQ